MTKKKAQGQIESLPTPSETDASDPKWSRRKFLAMAGAAPLVLSACASSVGKEKPVAEAISPEPRKEEATKDVIIEFAAEPEPTVDAAPIDLDEPIREVDGKEERFRRYGDGPAPELGSQAPLFTFAHMTDTHFGTRTDVAGWLKGSDKTLKAALDYCNDTLKPDFSVFTGDMISLEAHSEEELTAFKKFVDGNLKSPWYPVWGNHDGPQFAKVFGKDNYSWEHKGMHFVALAIEYVQWDAGFGDFKAFDWLKKTLDAKPDMPTFVFIHNPIAVPLPTFSTAFKVHDELKIRPQVVALIAGHLHMDSYGFKGGYHHLVGPMLFRNTDKHGFNLMEVYSDRLVVVPLRREKDGYVQKREKARHLMF